MLNYLNTILEQWPTDYQDRAVEVVSLVRNNTALSNQLSCLMDKKVRTEGGGRKGGKTSYFYEALPFLRFLHMTMSDCVCV